ncbi:hypothetical protein [Ruegeria sp. Ofav3-42]|uniref:hypothetical protein n=1 Tax=Ruegeria sp. Ofav3-42 TaxID=2917759 RepID=UPI001EF652EB|nr:hypothetical protein [Ruegeria sp. Ofav3-42]MCG7521045.1 hypothetical protein [Ruegeria sp. Ofav3-42]
MSVDFDLLNTVEPVSAKRLAEKHTGSLLMRLKALRRLQESFSQSDWSDEEREAVDAQGLIAFKDSESWQRAWSELKAELSTREHVPPGGKELRRLNQQAKQKR